MLRVTQCLFEYASYTVTQKQLFTSLTAKLIVKADECKYVSDDTLH